MAQSITPVPLPSGTPGQGIAYVPGLGSTDQIAGSAYLQQFGGIEGFSTAAGAATVTPNAATGAVFEYTACPSAVTVAAPTNPSIGQIITVVIVAAGGAATVITLNSVFRGGPTTTTAASKAAVGSWVYDGTSWFNIGNTTNI